ncbi:hypothetical protein [Pyrobaculum aerophilum]|uniref:Uncharacterized protein n=2 Tax=Pyrobaculum aerophilum TaxID=13773 RepID=Q8ZY13_PYRAE|nr:MULTISPECIES: hypothetical protein [Pyrobaculum]AAL63183.1 hypothetical protein PAE0992 [Pyrobaculum aerophilum str. IM2]MCX8136154.1 hypothetical protein [Pyrobaculum aerophilum]HII48055.1 hypothetical protein [Pyrobaculum aerophilum]
MRKLVLTKALVYGQAHSTRRPIGDAEFKEGLQKTPAGREKQSENALTVTEAVLREFGKRHTRR